MGLVNCSILILLFEQEPATDNMLPHAFMAPELQPYFSGILMFTC